MKTSTFIIIAALFGWAATAAAAGPGSCGRGKVWNPETKTCVPKPRGSGSH